jgi:hypothetical protein
MGTSSPPERSGDPDRELLAFAAEHRFVLPAQVAWLLDVATSTAARRLRDLRSTGRLRDAGQQLRHEPAAFQVTRAGLGAVDCDLGPPRPIDIATYRHDVGITWLAIGAHRGVLGDVTEVVSERRMRSEDRRGDRAGPPPVGAVDAHRHGVRLGIGERGERNLHYPDLGLVSVTGHRVAFELELSTKPPAKRERILAGYAADRRTDAVVYLVNSRAAGDAITRSAARVGADKVQVQRFAWADGRAPGDSPRTAGRGAPRVRRAARATPRASSAGHGLEP